MTINTKKRLSIVASAFALVFAAPAAFAQGTGELYQGIYTDPQSGYGSGVSDSRLVVEKKNVPSNAASNTGTWYGNIHTDPQTGDGTGVSHSRLLMEKKIVPSNPAEKLIQLTDGTTVHVFADGKMAMESKFGRASYMEPGHVMDARDGKRIIMNGNEVMRLDQLLNKNYIGG